LAIKSRPFLIVCWRHCQLFPVISDFMLPVSLVEARQKTKESGWDLVIFVDFRFSSGTLTNNQIYFVLCRETLCA